MFEWWKCANLRVKSVSKIGPKPFFQSLKYSQGSQYIIILIFLSNSFKNPLVNLFLFLHRSGGITLCFSPRTVLGALAQKTCEWVPTHCRRGKGTSPKNSYLCQRIGNAAKYFGLQNIRYLERVQTSPGLPGEHLVSRDNSQGVLYCLLIVFSFLKYSFLSNWNKCQSYNFLNNESINSQLGPY